MKTYKATIELEFASNMSLAELNEQMQVCLVELDLGESPANVTLDNIHSEKFAIADYTFFQIEEVE